MLGNFRIILFKNVTIRCGCGKVFTASDNCNTQCPKCGQHWTVKHGVAF